MLSFSKKHNYKGLLICVEGIDGSGKSTQIELLHSWLQSKGVDVILTQWNSSELIANTTKKAKKKKSLVLFRKYSLPPHLTLPHPHLIPILVKPCHPLPPLYLGGWPISSPAYTTLPKSSMCLLH